MPTYEYACSACGNEWEQTQRITEAPLEVCPKCAKSSAHRLISAGTNFILKGGGWYSDLYASPKAEKSEKTEKTSGEAAPSTTEAKGTADAKAKAGAKPASTDSSTPAASASPTSSTAPPNSST